MAENDIKPKIQADVKILTFLQKQGQFMFLIPFTAKHKTFVRVAGMIGVVALMPISYKLLSLRFSFFSNLPVTCLVMDILNFFSDYICLATMYSSQSFYYDNWQRLGNTVSKTESLLKKTRFTLTKDYFFWKYGFMHAIYIILHGWQMYLWILENQFNLVFSYIGFRVVHYCLTFMTLVIHEWLVFLSARYNYLEKYLKRIFSRRILLTHHIAEELHMIGGIYKNLTVISRELNTIFSVYLFLLIFLSMMLTLHGLSYAILLESTLSTSFFAVVYVALHMANVMALVISYEKLQKESRNVIKTCLFTQEEIPQSQLRTELAHLAKYLKKLKPKMSAVGFFEINFQLISGYISIVIGYLIIILQFNTTFD